jgi:hypothetical protein
MVEEPIDEDDSEPPPEPPAKSARARTQRQRGPEKQFWQDPAFRRRVQRLARERGMPLADVMRACGVAVDYTYKPAGARDTNVVMAIADYLGVTPTELAGWPAPAAPPSAAAEEDPELHRTRTLVRLFSEQTVAMLYVVLAMTRPDADPVAIAEALGLNGNLASALATAAKES